MYLQNIINNYQSLTPFSAANLVKIILEEYIKINNKYSILIDDVQHSFDNPMDDCIVNIHIYSNPEKTIENKFSIYIRCYRSPEHIRKTVETAIKSNKYFNLSENRVKHFYSG
jgi:hypothetical protein